MIENKYYDGGQLLSQMDINGQKPEIYMCTTNNSAGKSTWFCRWLIKRFKEHKEQFMLVYRFTYELDGVEDQFFGGIKELFFPEDEMTAKKRDKGIYTELFLNGELCGYAVALNLADQIKKKSHLFNHVARMFMDEFQSETSHYCQNEVEKLVAIHKAVARGGGSQSRYVPIFMCANPVSILNPYYNALGIATRLNKNVHFLKGDGWVLEQGFNESASKALSESAFNRAFAGSKYMAYSTQGVYLNDNDTFVEKLSGKSRYLLTVIIGGSEYAIREYPEYGYIYCDQGVDKNFPMKIAINTGEHTSTTQLVAKTNPMILTLRKYFDAGLFRFKNLKCKEAVLKMLAY